MTEIIDSPESGSRGLIITHEAISALKETGGWGKFLAILGFCFIALISVLSFFMGSVFEAAGMPSQFPASIFTGVYLAIALLYFFPVYYLYKFSSEVREALKLNDGNLLASALVNLKSLYKFMGIMAIIVFGIYALVFAGVLVRLMIH